MSIQTQKQKNVWSRIPDERTILQHFGRVSGAYKYILSYASSMEKLDWKNYGFEYDNKAKRYYPIITTESTTKILPATHRKSNCCTPKKIKVYNKNKGTTYHLRKRVWSFKLFRQQGYSKCNQWNRTHKIPDTGLLLEKKKKQ